MPFYLTKPSTMIDGAYAPNEREMPPVIVQLMDALSEPDVNPKLAEGAVDIVLDLLDLDSHRAAEELVLGIDLHPLGAQAFIDGLVREPKKTALIFARLVAVEATRLVRVLDRVDPIHAERVLEILKLESPHKAMELSAAFLSGTSGYYQGVIEPSNFKSRDGISLNRGTTPPITYRLVF